MDDLVNDARSWIAEETSIESNEPALLIIEGFLLYTYRSVKAISTQSRPELLGLSQDLETECPKLLLVNFLGVLSFKGDHNILR